MALGAILFSSGLICVAAAFATASSTDVAAQGPEPATGRWHAWFESPGGELAFGLSITSDQEQSSPLVHIHNGPELIAIPTVEFRGDEVLLRLDAYDSWITAKMSDDGRALDGTWFKTSSGGALTELPFHARHGAAGPDAATRPTIEISPRYSVKFESDDVPAVGLFRLDSQGALNGTFMTATGDYRYLAGTVEGESMTLSCFDGGHAFLFRATVNEDGTWSGDFWSRDVWHETWVATPDPDASLPDAFEQTVWAGSQDAAADLDALVFRDLNGKSRSIGSLRQDGQPMILKVFGSWCPNCHDAADHLVEIDRAYRDAGITIVGLAFEYTDDFERSARQVRSFARQHEIEFPLLVAGLADKARATESLPILDRVRSYPTTIFIHGDGTLRAIHTGYTGPATGAAHEHLKERFDSHVRAMLRLEPPGGEK